MGKQIIIYTFAFFAGLAIGLFLSRNSPSLSKNYATPGADTTSEKNIEYRSGGYQFINPLLECDSGQAFYQGRTAVLKEQLNNFIHKFSSQDKAVSVSVYFRDLNNGPWFGINENTKFVPASLMKVPVMIAYYKLAESNPEVLQKKITVSQVVSEKYEQSYKPSQKIEVGKDYTVEELIYYLIAFSDNDALTLLLQNMDQQFLNQSYTDLGVIIPGAKSLDDELTVKEYSSFFRLLYNASYINSTYSEQALQMLSKSDFKNGIVAGLPENIQVSHKFGERFINPTMNQQSTERQLHDCGIVYLPEHPYLVCIMSKGQDFNELSRAISDISKTIYESLSDKN